MKETKLPLATIRAPKPLTLPSRLLKANSTESKTRSEESYVCFLSGQSESDNITRRNYSCFQVSKIAVACIEGVSLCPGEKHTLPSSLIVSVSDFVGFAFNNRDGNLSGLGARIFACGSFVTSPLTHVDLIPSLRICN